jgi:hypothetical protein
LKTNKFIVTWKIGIKDVINKIMEIKQCSICKENKPLDDYYSDWRETKKKGKYLYYHPYCKECEKLKNASWRENNPEKRKESVRKNNRKPQVKAQIKMYKKQSRLDGRDREWQRNNKDKLKAYREKRKHKEHIISGKEWTSCKEYFNNECAYCGLHISEHFNRFKGEVIHTDFHKEHVDHDGSIYLDNCVPSCKTCNTSKHDSKLEDWYNINNPNFSEERLSKIIKWLESDYKLYFQGYRPKQKYEKKHN